MLVFLWRPPSCGGPGQLPSLPSLKSGPGDPVHWIMVVARLASTRASRPLLFRGSGPNLTCGNIGLLLLGRGTARRPIAIDASSTASAVEAHSKRRRGASVTERLRDATTDSYGPKESCIKRESIPRESGHF